MKNKTQEYFLVFIQFGSLGVILATTGWMELPLTVILFLVAATLLVTSAVAAMKIGNFHIVPSPVNGGKLVTRGPYRVIRHPMYTSILLTAIPLVADDFTLLRCTMLLLLIVDLVVKLSYEEKLLIQKYPDYKQYQLQSYRIIPFIF